MYYVTWYSTPRMICALRFSLFRIHLQQQCQSERLACTCVQTCETLGPFWNSTEMVWLPFPQNVPKSTNFEKCLFRYFELKQFQIYTLEFVLCVWHIHIIYRSSSVNKHTCLASFNPVFSKFANTPWKQCSVISYSRGFKHKKARDSLCFHSSLQLLSSFSFDNWAASSLPSGNTSHTCHG